MALQVNSVPQSETIMPGLPINAVSSRQPPIRDRGVLDRRQAFPRDLIHNVQDPEYSEKKARRLLPAFVKEVLYNLSMTVNRFDCFGPTFRWETGYDDSVVG
jgi:hypothetical protein